MVANEDSPSQKLTAADAVRNHVVLLTKTMDDSNLTMIAAKEKANNGNMKC